MSNGREACVGSSCSAKAPWLLKLAKIPNVWMLSETPPARRQVALVQPQHLGALDQPRIARRTGRADRVVRAGDPHVQRHLAGRIVGHRARVVVVRPETGVVVVALQLVDLVLRLDVAVLGHAQVDAHARLVDDSPSPAPRPGRPRWPQ